MKKLLIAILCPMLSWGAVCPANYTYFSTVDWDFNQAGTADSTNFAGLISKTSTVWKTAANSGHVQNATTCCASSGAAPADFVPFTCATGALLTGGWDVEKYVATTGELEAWVLLSTLNHATSNTQICLAYGNSGVSTYQGTSTGAWNSSIKLVSHYPNGTTLDTHDSTSNANTGSNHSATAGTGQIDGDAVFDGSTQFVDYGNTASLQITGKITLSAWVNVTAFPSSGNFSAIIEKGYDGATESYFMRTKNNSGTMELHGGTNFNFALWTISGWNTGEWHYLTLTNDGTNWILYFDGVSKATQADATGARSTTIHAYIGAMDLSGVNSRFFNGPIDEAEIWNTNQPTSSITSSYNQSKTSQTMVTVGAEASCSGARRMTLLGVGP